MGDRIDPDPFEAVTTETRVAILRSLAKRQSAAPDDPTLAFAELRERAGIGDSGNFNYHLDRLQPEFVRKANGGYRLTPAAIELVGTLRAGVAPTTDRGPVPLDGDCRLCGEALSATYEEGLLSVACENGHAQPKGILPPNAVADREFDEAVELLALRAVQQGELVRRGVCPTCYGEMVPTHVTFKSAPAPAEHGFRGTCEDCGMVYGGPTGAFLLRHHAVVTFCADHGVRLGDGGYWETDLPLVGGDVLDRDPLRIAVAERLDGERLRVVVDDTLSVVETNREGVDEG